MLPKKGKESSDLEQSSLQKDLRLSQDSPDPVTKEKSSGEHGLGYYPVPEIEEEILPERSEPSSKEKQEYLVSVSTDVQKEKTWC